MTIFTEPWLFCWTCLNGSIGTGLKTNKQRSGYSKLVFFPLSKQSFTTKNMLLIFRNKEAIFTHKIYFKSQNSTSKFESWKLITKLLVWVLQRRLSITIIVIDSLWWQWPTDGVAGQIYFSTGIKGVNNVWWRERAEKPYQQLLFSSSKQHDSSIYAPANSISIQSNTVLSQLCIRLLELK